MNINEQKILQLIEKGENIELERRILVDSGGFNCNVFGKIDLLIKE